MPQNEATENPHLVALDTRCGEMRWIPQEVLTECRNERDNLVTIPYVFNLDIHQAKHSHLVLPTVPEKPHVASSVPSPSLPTPKVLEALDLAPVALVQAPVVPAVVSKLEEAPKEELVMDFDSGLKFTIPATPSSGILSDLSLEVPPAVFGQDMVPHDA